MNQVKILKMTRFNDVKWCENILISENSRMSYSYGIEESKDLIMITMVIFPIFPGLDKCKKIIFGIWENGCRSE